MSFKLYNDNATLYQRTLLNHFTCLKTDTIYILKYFDIDLPSKIGKCIVVDVSENTSSFINANSSLYAVKLMPIEMNKGVAEITLIDYVLRKSGDEVIMSNTSSVVFSYKYDSQSKEYRLLKKVKHSI